MRENCGMCKTPGEILREGYYDKNEADESGDMGFWIPPRYRCPKCDYEWYGV